jgi:MFS family permease
LLDEGRRTEDESTPEPAEATDLPSESPHRPSSIVLRLREGISRNVFVLGVVSFFTDVASEMIVPIRSLFLYTLLLTPAPIVGLIEGLAEAASSLLKVASGVASDRVGARKPFILFGYSLSGLVKPFLALVSGWLPALLIIFGDRVGKGVRTSPRDALLADSTEPRYMGKAFGFHRSLDSLGAAIGPLLTALILTLSNNDYRAVFAWTAIPGALSVLVILLFLREKTKDTLRQGPGTRDQGSGVEDQGSEIEIRNPQSAIRVPLGPRFWMFTAIATLFALGNSSDAFVFLRANSLGESLVGVALIYAAYNIVYALLATPLGALSDRWGRLPVLISGYVAFGLVYAGWALATQSWNAWVLFIVYGIYTAATEGVARAFVTDLVPVAARGAALGWFNGLTGLAALPANLIGGWLWASFTPSTTFWWGAFMSALAVALMIAWLPWLRRGYTR